VGRGLTMETRYELKKPISIFLGRRMGYTPSGKRDDNK
jgi:hypothetical protein